MPGFEDIWRYMQGAWLLMMGRSSGLHHFEISADGFWNSFFAIPVALPALLLGWLAIANDLAADPVIFGSRASIVVRLAVIDILAWLVPLAFLALAVRPAGIADRFAHYVIASNWGSALLVWLMLPASLFRMATGPGDGTTLVSLALFVVTLVLSWRLTNAALGKGPAVATAVFAGMLVASLAMIISLQNMLGLSGADQFSG